MLHSILDFQCQQLLCLLLLLLLLLLLIAILGADLAGAIDEPHDNLTFDTSVLSCRGIAPDNTALFGQAPCYLLGESTMTLFDNDNSRSQVRIRFDEAGMLCAVRAFQCSTGPVSPPDYADSITCFNLRPVWPQAEIQPEPPKARSSCSHRLKCLVRQVLRGNW